VVQIHPPQPTKSYGYGQFGICSDCPKLSNYGAVASQKWETDYRVALGHAAQSKDAVLAAFVGLTWCHPCQLLEAEVFKKLQFLEWTLGRVVLLQIDFPQNVDEAPAEYLQLREKYNQQGFPTIIGLDATGADLGRVVGYSAGYGVANWIASFEAATGL
jgi:thiol:disulfide interchange protein